MKALTVTAILLTSLLAGCATSGSYVTPVASQQAECEGQRGGGVWLAGPGVCMRGGGGM